VFFTNILGAHPLHRSEREKERERGRERVRKRGERDIEYVQNCFYF
jgi:hypothetical protein